jgi:hypothetical protein
VSFLALVSVSCADGTDEMSSDMPMAGTTAGGGGAGGGGGGGAGGTPGPRCGDGQIDMNIAIPEQCDPPGATQLMCEDLGMPGGPGSMVACNAQCQLMTMLCGQAVTAGAGGSGSMGGNGG